MRSTIRRAAQSWLTVIALSVGTAAVVTILGTSLSASAEIGKQLASLDSKTAVVTLTTDAWQRSDDQIASAQRDSGLLSSIGTFTILSSDVSFLSSSRGDHRVKVPVIIATTAGLAAREANVIEGTLLSAALEVRGTSSIILGAAAAENLGINLTAGSHTVTLGTQKFDVVAIVADNTSQSLLSTAAVITPLDASLLGLLPPTQDLEAQVNARGASHVADYLPLAISPAHPDSVSVSMPPSATQLRAGISGDTQSLVLFVSLATFIMSVFSITTTMQIAVRERRPEIGIYLALGMRRRDIAVKFIFEALCLGILGAALGWTAGVLAAAGIAAVSGWDTYFPPVVWLVPAIGLLVGTVGGIAPAIQASRMDPSSLIRARG